MYCNLQLIELVSDELQEVEERGRKLQQLQKHVGTAWKVNYMHAHQSSISNFVGKQDQQHYPYKVAAGKKRKKDVV